MESEASGTSVEIAVPADLPDILFVAEGRLHVGTEDDAVGLAALSGFRYLLVCEFSRQLPALSLLYDLDVALLDVQSGSRDYGFKVVAKLKRRIRAEVKKAGVVATFSLLIGVPSALLATYDLYARLFPPVQSQLNSGMPQASPTIRIDHIRPADQREATPTGPQSFEL
jgi:hypothetical protein